MTIVERMPVVDVDSHLTEPPSLWADRLPTKWADQMPRVVTSPKGREVWLMGDKFVQGAWATAAAGWKEYWPDYPLHQDDVDPAAYDPIARATRLTEFGITAQVIYPNLLAFNLVDLLKVGDGEFQLACVRAYNDFLTDFSAAAPGRFIPICVLPFWDVDASVAEIQRCHEAGHRGALFANSPEIIGLPRLRNAHWNPVFAAAQECGMSLNFHIGFGGFDTTLGDFPSRQKRQEGEYADEAGAFRLDVVKSSTLSLISNSRAIVEVLVSGILERFPTLNFVSVESGFGYVPYLLEAIDWQWLNNGAAAAFPERMMPSEYFKRQMYATFWFEEKVLNRTIELYPDNVMFESDFPHPTCLAPGPVSHSEAPDRVIEANLAKLPEDVTRKLLYETAARVYHLDDLLPAR